MTPLKSRLLRQIAQTGPISLSDYWAQCLFDPQHGYYTTGYPIGADGDFITAPEVSQIFGELIGAWWLATLRQNDLRDIALVEIGPGRGTLMFDMLRTLGKLDPELKNALPVHMVEISPRLSELQREKLASSGFRIAWHQSLKTLPRIPMGIVANELFDAIPSKAFVKLGGRWHERAIGTNKKDDLVFQAIPKLLDELILPEGHQDQPDGTVFEYAPARETFMQDVAGQLANGGGFGLFIDYGHGKSGFGDTLQAIRKHAFTNPLAEPGEADLTTHVDFQVLAESARQKGCDVSPLLEQGTFLFRLGIDERKQRIAGMQPHLRNALETACERLIGNGQMGRLFKVMGISSPSVELPALGSAR